MLRCRHFQIDCFGSCLHKELAETPSTVRVKNRCKLMFGPKCLWHMHVRNWLLSAHCFIGIFAPNWRNRLPLAFVSSRAANICLPFQRDIWRQIRIRGQHAPTCSAQRAWPVVFAEKMPYRFRHPNTLGVLVERLKFSKLSPSKPLFPTWHFKNRNIYNNKIFRALVLNLRPGSRRSVSIWLRAKTLENVFPLRSLGRFSINSLLNDWL